MNTLPAVTVVLVGLLLPISSGAAEAVNLEYRGEVGRQTTYRLSLTVTGHQTSLGERRPMEMRAELELREKVVATGPAGALLVRVNGRPLKVSEPTGTFSARDPESWPVVEVWMTARGEALDSSVVASDRHAGPFERSWASLMAAPAVVVLPDRAVEVGEGWRWEREAAEQTSRLASLRGAGHEAIAQIESAGRAPIAVQESSDRLGLTTSVKGEQRQVSELTLLVGRGVVLRHTGQMFLRTAGEIVMDGIDGLQRFPVRAEIKVDFDLRLVEEDGRPATGD